MNCLSCGASIHETDGFARCRCGGAWVGEPRLVAMAEEMKHDHAQLPWAPRAGAGRPCPTCGATMAAVALLHVALDRCPAHGIWFDANELAAVLQRAADLPAELPAGDPPASAAHVEPVAPLPEHVNLRTWSNRIALVFFELLDGLMKPRGYYSARAAHRFVDDH